MQREERELPARMPRREDEVRRPKDGLGQVAGTCRSVAGPCQGEKFDDGKPAKWFVKSFFSVMPVPPSRGNIPKTRPRITRNNQRWPNCVPVRTVSQSPFWRHSTKPSPLMMEATSQLQANHDTRATRSVHKAARQVSRWISIKQTGSCLRRHSRQPE